MVKYFNFVLLLCCTFRFGNGSEEKSNFNIAASFKKGETFQDVNNNFQGKEYDEKNANYQGQNYYEKNENYVEEYVGNPDFDAEIYRPCPVFDLNCIRKYFAEHSKCKIRRGPLPRSLFLSQDAMYFSRVNITAPLNNVRIDGIRSTRIEEFYINKRTNKMVFSINIRGLISIVPTVYFEFFRNRMESIVLVTESAAYYESLTFTAVIPNIYNLELKNAEITTYVDVLPPFVLGPGILNSTDPTVVQQLAEYIADVSTDTQELMLTFSQYFPPAYIQYNICDFGLKVLPVDTRDNVFTIL